MFPFYSIILPIYNVEAYLRRCIRSVLEQGFQDFELILVDDGSSDGSGALCDALAEGNDRLRVIHKPNGGLSSARNAGLEIARGQYIWFVDSDDWIEENALQRLYEVCTRDEPDVVKFNYTRVETESRVCCANVPAGQYSMEEVAQLRRNAMLWGGKYVLSACTHLYKRALLRDRAISFVSERQIGSEDYLFNLQILLHAQTVTVIEDALYNYEQRMGSLTQRYSQELPARYARLYDHLTAYYQQQGALCRYEKDLATFYVWHLMRGTCIPNEYTQTREHTLAQGRRNIRRFLRSETFRCGIKKCETKQLSKKQKLQFLALKYQLEPVFYWLYVVKPRLKKGKSP